MSTSYGPQNAPAAQVHTNINALRKSSGYVTAGVNIGTNNIVLVGTNDVHQANTLCNAGSDSCGFGKEVG